MRALTPILMLLAALLPAGLLYAYGIAKLRPSTSRAIGAALTALAFGALALVGASVAEFFLDRAVQAAQLAPVGHAALRAVVVAALPEEAAKFLAVLAASRWLARRGWAADRVMTGLVVALGFATLEDLAYTATAASWPSVAMLRGAVTFPEHALFGLVMGVALAQARVSAKPWRAVMAAFLLPALLHAAFDFPALLHSIDATIDWPLPALVGVVGLGGIAALAGVNRRLAALCPAVPPAPIRPWQSATAVLLMLGGLGAGAAGAIIQLRGGGTAAEILWGALLLGLLPLVLGLDLVRALLRVPVRPSPGKVNPAAIGQ